MLTQNAEVNSCMCALSRHLAVINSQSVICVLYLSIANSWIEHLYVHIALLRADGTLE